MAINLSRLNNAIDQAFDIAVEAQAEAFQKAIADDVWEWPRTTVRRNGDIVDSPRDAVDQEDLIDSLVISRNANSAIYEWESDHAAIVHDGATTKSGTELPARPWTHLGLQECDAAEVMQRKLNQIL